MALKIATGDEVGAKLTNLLSNPLLQEAFTKHLYTELSNVGIDTKSPQIFSDFIAWANNPAIYLPDQVESAIKQRKLAVERGKAIKKELIRVLGLTPAKGEGVAAALWASATVVELSRLETPYPPRDKWIIEDSEIWGLWEAHITKHKQPDPRVRHRGLHTLDETQLQCNVAPDESVIVFDKDSGELIFAQLRNFCQVPAIVEWVDSVLKKNLSVQRNVRMEDAGSIVISGFTAGSRARPSFDWARNFLNPSRHPQSEQEAMRYEAASVFAMFWNMVQKVCPSAVIDDRFMEQTGLISMDPKEFSGQGGSEYTVNYEGSNITFKGVDMAPPSGVFAQNYARLSRPVHSEKQPHKYALSWTTFRNVGVRGGHFYISSYGLRCCASSNAFTLWDPSLLHGTSLQSISPNAEEIVQSGLSIVTGERLPGAFKRYQQNQLTAEQLARECTECET
ncbi:hypothetical protein F5890DRAFT_1419882 [Lentinula detonsa]|uniref:Uncharacterized protein n=1 Tax=Lentinula detonsa TaxID=2804962 RepID=A0AA38PS46_9AGAR|nr:hypothetical protein F5890DRAFT_1419882 [Lentinula detonsa]